jgi:RimJ/RimL family protein N-acetyltransferase
MGPALPVVEQRVQTLSSTSPPARHLDGGAAVTVRPIEPEDAARLRRLFFRLSPRTIYLRFFGPVREPSPSHLRHLANVDHDLRQALVAVADDEIVGVARYDRDPATPARAEVAIVVEDAWQRQGLAKELLAGLADDAQRHGVTAITATVLGENERTMNIARHLNPAIRARLDQGEWLLEIPLAPRMTPTKESSCRGRSISPVVTTCG